MEENPVRLFRNVALGAASLALIVGACTSGGGNSSTSSPSTSAASASPSSSAGGASPSTAASGPSIASTMVLAGPPECPNRPFCAKGLKDKYGITFKDFKATDVGGPITIRALIQNDAQVGLLLTSDPAITTNNFVLLQDDKQLQLADNLIPVVRQDVLDKSPGIKDLLNGISAKLTQEALTDLNKQVTVDQKNTPDVAKAWLTTNGLLPGAGGSGKGSIKVGSTNFYEQEILGELFSQVLEANGYTVERKFQLGNREVVYPALKSGQIDVVAEYAATLLEFVNKGAGEATTDANATAEKLRTRLATDKLTALDPAAATDQNGFVVTKQTADKYSLTKLSDLTKPAP